MSDEYFNVSNPQGEEGSFSSEFGRVNLSRSNHLRAPTSTLYPIKSGGM